MKLNPKDHDFDWVTARQKCRVDMNFKNELRSAAKQACDAWDFAYPGYHFAFLDGSSPESSKYFTVSRTGRSAAFALDGASIKVSVSLDPDSTEVFHVTRTLSDDGRCIIQIDGKGDYLVWQVVRRALQPVMTGVM